LDEALRRLELVNERSARVVEFRFFGGLTYDEIGEVLGVSGVTARRSWMFGKTWLRRELAG
ncbi:MAG: ECF-type sigma factor, partial [Bacteroidota bacterium]